MRHMLGIALFGLCVSTLPSQASAAQFFYQGKLSGSAEDPPNASPGTGTTQMIYDDVAHSLWIHISFSGLAGNTTAAHIHRTLVPLTGNGPVMTTVPTFAGFPLGVSSGTYETVLDLTSATSFNPAFILATGSIFAAESELALALKEGRAYLNIHTNVAPGGEIRSFLTPVPEPESWALMIGGFALAGSALRRRYRVTVAA
jgi:ABC-type multidrug transport system permease subunit